MSAPAEEFGRIVLLNGSSSAGKTSLAHAIQLAMPDPWHHIALDQYRDGMPGQYRGMNAPEGTSGHAGLNVAPATVRGELVTEIRFGPIGRRMLRGMHRAIAAFAAAGNNVIVDDILFDADILDDYLCALRECHVLFVGVRCALDVVEARESTRLGRFPGTAHSHFVEVHAHGCYDLEVDTARFTAVECARIVRDRLLTNAAPQAFSRLRAARHPLS